MLQSHLYSNTWRVLGHISLKIQQLHVHNHSQIFLSFLFTEVFEVSVNSIPVGWFTGFDEGQMLFNTFQKYAELPICSSIRLLLFRCGLFLFCLPDLYCLHIAVRLALSSLDVCFSPPFTANDRKRRHSASYQRGAMPLERRVPRVTRNALSAAWWSIRLRRWQFRYYLSTPLERRWYSWLWLGYIII